jgi:4-hydroxy-3-polyprenylbenzoate decarboxylase
MIYQDLRSFIEDLEKAGELLRIKEVISPYLEITEITDRVCKQYGPALLFENVLGYNAPVLTNAFGSFKRICMALGVNNLDDLGKEILDFLQVETPDSLIKKFKLLPKLKRLNKMFPKLIKTAPCQEVVLKGEEVDLTEFPILHCWPLDGGRFITLPLVFTKHPLTRRRNVGMYRMQIYDKKTTGMHWHPPKGGAQHYRVAEALEKTLEVAVAIGADPIMTYAATAPLPEDTDEVLFAGFLRNEPVRLVRCLTINQEVPANAQIVLEGYIKPHNRKKEGPFGDHTGYYSLPDDYPVFHVTTITHRKHFIYPATIVGRPPQEDCYLAKATERLFLPLIKKQLPEILDINLPIEGVFHNLAFISIDKRYPGHAKKVMQALWGLGQLSLTKILVIFDKEVNVQDISEVIWRLGNNIDPKRDTIFIEGPVDTLDHSSSLPLLGSKMGIDATSKWPEEGFNRQWPPVIEMTPQVKEKIDKLWKKLNLKK